MCVLGNKSCKQIGQYVCKFRCRIPFQTQNRKVMDKVKKKHMLEMLKQHQQQMLSSESEDEVSQLREEVRRLKVEVSTLRRQNSELQAALCSKIFEKEKMWPLNSQGSAPAKSPEPIPTNSKDHGPWGSRDSAPQQFRGLAPQGCQNSVPQGCRGLVPQRSDSKKGVQSRPRVIRADPTIASGEMEVPHVSSSDECDLFSTDGDKVFD